MKYSKSTVALAALLASVVCATSAQAGSFTVSAEGMTGGIYTSVDQPTTKFEVKQHLRGFGLGGSYSFGEGYDALVNVKNIVSADRKLFEAHADMAKTFDFANIGKLRVAPIGVNYVRLVNDYGNGDISTDYNVYYAPNLTYSKELGYNVFAQVGATYNYGIVSHFHNSGTDITLPRSNGYEGLVKLGYNITKDVSATLAYNRAKYDYAGNNIHYNTEAKVSYTSLGVNYSF